MEIFSTRHVAYLSSLARPNLFRVSGWAVNIGCKKEKT
jgi:hypothetical protein